MQSIRKDSGSTSTVGTVQGADAGRLLSGGMGQKDTALTIRGMWIKSISQWDGYDGWIRMDAITDVRYERVESVSGLPEFYSVKVRVAAEQIISRPVMDCSTREEADLAVITLMSEIDNIRRTLGGLS